MAERSTDIARAPNTQNDDAIGSSVFSFLVESSQPCVDESYLKQIILDEPSSHAANPSSVTVLYKDIYSTGVRPAYQQKKIARATLFFKRAADIALSSAALVLLSPVSIFIAAILAVQKGPILFAQERVKKGGELFRCYKFRTMKVGADAMLSKILASDPRIKSEWRKSQKLVEDPRITRIGKLLRSSSLDELPQLLNVLKGDMSLVGPRPILWSEMPKYRGFLSYYLSVRPGLTGLWQVSGRNETTYRRRVSLDVAYVKNISVGFDFQILAKTIPVLLKAQGAH